MRQKLGIEKCSYDPNFKMLKLMLQWSKDYDSGKDKLKSKISNYEEKVIILRNNIEKCSYDPNFKMLKLMLQWSKDYDSGKDKLKSKISNYEEKVIILRNNDDINNLIINKLSSLNK